MIKTSVSIWKKLIGKALNHCTTTATGKGGGDNQYWGSLVSGSSALTTKKIENPKSLGPISLAAIRVLWTLLLSLMPTTNWLHAKPNGYCQTLPPRKVGGKQFANNCLRSHKKSTHGILIKYQRAYYSAGLNISLLIPCVANNANKLNLAIKPYA